jgi:DNA-binding IclR family transcriptional regulator
MPPVRAVDRALGILNALGERDMRLVEIARELKLHKATATRLLASLARADMVARDERGYYGLGSGVALLSGRVFRTYRGLVEMLRVPMRAIWEATRETVAAHVRIGLDRVCIEELESPQNIAYRTGVGSRARLHVGSGGKVLLAFLRTEEREQIIQDLRMDAVTERTVTSRTRLAAELEEIRKLGYAISIGERTPGSAAASAPVFDKTGRLLAAVSVLGPEFRLTPAVLKRCAALLKENLQPLALPGAAASGPPARSLRNK